MGIITKDLVRKAVYLVEPAVKEILKTKDLIWGPGWVEGLIEIPGLEDPLLFTLGEITKWNPEWGETVSFSEIAAKKLQAAKREGVNTSIVVETKPWKLEKGEYLYAGGAIRDGICVAVSGAKGRVDEAIAEMVVSAIVMLAFLETEYRIEKDIKQI